MATEISLDLINQLKVSLRKQAKLSSFDPVGDYSDFSSLPTAAEAIAELDSSAPYLRCRNCKGKLLRGIESLICVFCGKQQRTSDNPPDPIKFTSTSGYKLFLSSLNLDGSEMVEPIKETNGSSSRGAMAPVVKGIAVSKFLDLEIQWSAREEKSINSGPGDGQSLQNKNSLNLGGINLDDFFVEGRGDPVESKPEEEDDFNDPRSLSLFDSVKSQGVVESQQNENVGLFKGIDAQENVSSEKHENLSLFVGRDAQDSVSLAEQGNFGFFEEKDAGHSLKEDENLSLFEGKDAQRNSSSKDDESFGFFEAKDAQRNSSSKDDESFGFFEAKDAQRNSSSKDDESFGFFEGAPSSNTGRKSSDDKVVVSSSSSDWDSDFQSADRCLSHEKISGDPFVSSPIHLAAQMDSVFGSGKDFLPYEKPADSSIAYASNAGDWLQDDLFGNVAGKTQNNDPAVHDKNEGQVVGGNESSSMDIDWIGDDLWQTNEKKPIEKTTTDDNDDDDDWNDFESSANKAPINPLPQTMESSQEKIFDRLALVKNDVKEHTEDAKQNTGTSVISDIGKGQEDDLFGTWDSFTSSTVLQTTVQSPTNHVNAEMNLFGATNNHRDLDSDFFSESIGGQTNSKEVKAMPSGTSTAYASNAGDWFQDDLFGNVTGKTQNNDPAVHDKNEGQVVGGNQSSSMDIDWIGDDIWQTNENKPIEKTTTDDNDDDWNDFESSANKAPINPLPQTMESSQEKIFDRLARVKNDVKEQSEDAKQNSGTSVISDIGKGQDDDLFGTWDSFASSTVLQTTVQPPTNHVNPSSEQNAEMNLFGATNNHRDLDSDFFSESIGGQP